jgi:ADP-heptose:LPS heptosyltransferase
MSLIKRIEHAGKRALVSFLTVLVRTPRASRNQVFGAPPRRVLVIRQHNQMGDMLLAVPALRAIKETFASVDLTLLTARINRDVMLNHPYVDHVLTFDARRPFAVPSLIASMRRSHYDVVIVLHTVSFSFTSAVLGLLSGARFRVGSSSEKFRNRLSRSFYHLELPLPSEAELATMNEAEHNLYPLRAAGIDTKNISPVVVPSVSDVAWARHFMSERAELGALTVAVHPGAGKIQNIWPPERFAQLIDLLSQRARLGVIVLQGPRDAETVARFCRVSQVPQIVIRDRSIGEVAAVMQQCDLVLCNDTGVMHVASAAGARTLAIFGPTDPSRWAPRCDNLHIVRGKNGRLEELDPVEVFRAALGLLTAPSGHQ